MSRLDTKLRLTQSEIDNELNERDGYISLVAAVCFSLMAVILTGWVIYTKVIPAQNETIARIKILDTQCQGVHR